MGSVDMHGLSGLGIFIVHYRSDNDGDPMTPTDSFHFCASNMAIEKDTLMNTQTQEYWYNKALQERRTAHINRTIYPKHNWRIYYALDMQRAIRSWQYFRKLRNQQHA